MKSLWTNFIQDEDGQGMVEYALIIAGVALLAMAALFLLGPQIGNMFTNIKTKLS